MLIPSLLRPCAPESRSSAPTDCPDHACSCGSGADARAGWVPLACRPSSHVAITAHQFPFRPHASAVMARRSAALCQHRVHNGPGPGGHHACGPGGHHACRDSAMTRPGIAHAAAGKLSDAVMPSALIELPLCTMQASVIRGGMHGTALAFYLSKQSHFHPQDRRG